MTNITMVLSLLTFDIFSASFFFSINFLQHYWTQTINAFIHLTHDKFSLCHEKFIVNFNLMTE